VVNIAEAIQDALTQAGLSADDIDWFVPHQANQRILDGTAKRLHIGNERVISTVASHGNTSAASVPLAFDVARKDGRTKAGALVLMEAMGGGFTWNGLIVVTGTLTFNGGGSGVNITGAVMSGDSVTLNGGLEIYYDSCAVGESLTALGYEMINWRQL